MASIMEDDYAPATRYPWISALSPLVIVALIALVVWRRRSSN